MGTTNNNIKTPFFKRVRGCGWEVFDLKYIGRGEGLGGGEGNVTFISGGRGPALSPIFYLNVFLLFLATTSKTLR